MKNILSKLLLMFIVLVIGIIGGGLSGYYRKPLWFYNNRFVSEPITEPEKTESTKVSADISAQEDRIDREWVLINNKKRELEKREKALETKEKEVEEKIQQLKLLTELRQQDTQDQESSTGNDKPTENKEQLKEVVEGFEKMLDKDAANILLEMLKEDRESVLALLRTMDDRTRERIISAISRKKVDVAASLVKELMVENN